MKIYTSYFAMQKKIDMLGLTTFSISRLHPKFYKGEVFWKLAPSSSILTQYKEGPQNEGAQKVYTYRFQHEVLDRLDPKDIYAELSVLSGGHDIVLLCYEKSSDFCHRHLVAKWLTDAGYPVEELTF